MVPKIVLVITDQESNAQLKKLGVDFLELRVDLFKSLDANYLKKEITKRRALEIPLLLTIRNQKKEGALKEFSDQKKLALMQELLPLVHWVDVELSSPLSRKIIRLAKSLNKKVVVSAHNFDKTPVNMEQLLNKCLLFGCDLVKFAFKAKDAKDLIRLLEFTDRHKRSPLVTMCVGPLGGLSRLILPSVGSRWVYTFLNKPTAAGQINIHALKEQLRLYSKK